MSKHFLIVDGNSLAHANHNTTPLTVGDFQVQSIFGCLRSAQKLAEMYPRSEQIWLWDGKAQWRIDLYPAYKGNREPLDAAAEASKEAFRRQAPFTEKALNLLGVKQIRSPLLEADDLAGYFSRSMSAQGHKVTLVSGDRDWITLVDSNVSWFDPIRNRKVDMDNLLDFTGYFTTEAYVQGKALQGDNSDNIIGIPKMGEKTAALFLAEWGDVRKFFAAVDNGTYTPKKRASKTATSLHPEQVLASPEGRAIFERNVKLMDLRQSRKPEQGEVIIQRGEPNAHGFISLCERLAFASILRERRSFLANFGIECPDMGITIPAPVAKDAVDEQLLHAGVDLLRPMRA